MRRKDIKNVIVIDWARFDALCVDIYEQVKGMGFDTIISIEHGGSFPARRVYMMLADSIRYYYQLKVYRESGETEYCIGWDYEQDKTVGANRLKGRRAIIIDDIFSTGNTMRKVSKFCIRKGVIDFKFAVLVRRPECECVGLCLDRSFAVIFPWKSSYMNGLEMWPEKEFE